MCGISKTAIFETRTMFNVSIHVNDYISEHEYNVVKKKLVRYLSTTEGCDRKNCYFDTDKYFEHLYTCDTDNYIEIRKRVQDIIVDL